MAHVFPWTAFAVPGTSLLRAIEDRVRVLPTVAGHGSHLAWFPAWPVASTREQPAGVAYARPGTVAIATIAVVFPHAVSSRQSAGVPLVVGGVGDPNLGGAR